MKDALTLCAGLLLASLALPAAGAGPAVINGIEAQLKAIQAATVAAETQLKQTLEGYGGDAGDQGLRLRRLRREQAELERQLKAALGAEAERTAAAAAVLGPPPPAPAEVIRPTGTSVAKAPPAPTASVGNQATSPPTVTRSDD